MQSLYGADWRERLDDEELRRAEEAEEAARLVTARLLEGASAVAPEERLAEEAVAGDSKDGVEPDSQDDLSPGGKRRREDTKSSASSAPPSPRALRELVRLPYDPAKETLKEYEGRVLRVAEALNVLGHPLEGEEVQEIIFKATYTAKIADLPKPQRVAKIKEMFALLLVDESKERGELELRMSILSQMLEAHGGRLSAAANKLFSNPNSTPGKESVAPTVLLATPLGTPRGRTRKKGGLPQPFASESGPEPELEKLRKQLFESEKRVRDLEKTHLASPQQSDKSEAADVAQTLADALKGQTEALKAMLSNSGNKRQRSTIQVSPKVAWPTLNDNCSDHRSVQEFYETFESTVQLANDGEGMNELEMLTTLKACLKEHRLKSYELIYKRHQAAGTLKTDPGKVYSEIKSKRLLFAETRKERNPSTGRRRQPRER